MAVTVRPVVNKKDQDTFLKVPFPIYANDPHWVAPMFFERNEHLSPKKNPWFQHGKAQLFIAERGGKPVGRISAQYDQLHLDRHKDSTGFFGFLEAVDDKEVFAALFKTAEDWLRSQGLKRARGPFSFSINDESGLLIEGFDHMPNMMMGHAPRYYQTRIEALGYHKAKDLYAYQWKDRQGLNPSIRKLIARMKNSGKLTVRPLNKKKMKDEIQIIMRLFNDAWSSNWGFVPFTEAEVKAMATNFKLLLDEKAVNFALWEGKEAAFCVAIGNLNEWFRGLNGRLLPFGWARVANKIITKKSKSVRVPLMGVAKEFQDGAVGAGLALACIEASSDYVISRGVEEGEFSWILEDNLRVRHILESMGSRIYKTYRVYEKPL